MNVSKFAPSLVLCLLSAPLSAAVIYVDASVNNTVGAVSGLVDWNNGSDATATGGTATTNDSLWRYRIGFGNTGIWEATSSSSTPEDAVQLLTTVSVANGTYDVYVFFLAVEPGTEGSPAGGGVDTIFRFEPDTFPHRLNCSTNSVLLPTRHTPDTKLGLPAKRLS